MYNSAHWNGLRQAFATQDWNWMEHLSSDSAATQLTQIILAQARNFIKTKQVEDTKSSHPWLSDRVANAVAAKGRAPGTDEALEATVECSQVILQEYFCFVKRTKDKLANIKRDSKQWLKFSRQLLQQSVRATGIAALTN